MSLGGRLWEGERPREPKLSFCFRRAFFLKKWARADTRPPIRLASQKSRIDDPDAGWKGRGLWDCVSTRAPFHMETGKRTTSKVVHFQLRPNPLAK